MSDLDSSENGSSASSTSTQWPSQSSNCSNSSRNNELQTLHYQEILNRAIGSAEDVDHNTQHEQTDSISDAIHKAAQLLHSAEILLLVTGAGFSADSGLATYVDVADIDAYRERGWRYRDLCRPFVVSDSIDIIDHKEEYDEDKNNGKAQDDMNRENNRIDMSCPIFLGEQNEEMRHPQYFFGFWGQCINDYRKIRPHEGYEIIARWGHSKNESEVAQAIRKITNKLEGDGSKSVNISQEPYYVSPKDRAGAFFFFTSNVDAHSYDVFQSHEIRECHGNTEVWQCRHFSCGTNSSWGLDYDSSSEDGHGKGRPMAHDNQESKQWERRLWRLPLDHVFEIDSTMSAPPTKEGETHKPAMQEAESQDKPVLNDSPIENLPKKRKSESELTQHMNETPEVLNYLQSQFANADDLENNATVPAHIGDVHGKQRVSHLKNMSHPTSFEEPDHYLTLSPTDNWPRCPRCNDLARPAVLMFEDLDWVYNSEQEKRWQRWYNAMLKLCKERAGEIDDSEFSSVNESDISNSGWENVSEGESSDCNRMAAKHIMNITDSKSPDQLPNDHASPTDNQPLKVLILEIGCGYNVPTCRMISETLVKHLADRGGDPTLVRINPTHPEADNDEIEDRFIGIEEKGLCVLQKIDALYQKLLLEKSTVAKVDK